MAGSPTPELVGDHATGIAMALSNGVAEGMDAIQRDTLTLDRMMVAGAARFDALIQRADGLRALIATGMVPIVAHGRSPLQEAPITVEPRPAPPNSAGDPPPVRNRSRTDTGPEVEAARPLSQSTASPAQPDRASDRLQQPESSIAGTVTAKESSSIAAFMPALNVPTAQASLAPPRSTKDKGDTQPPTDPIAVISAGLVALSPGTATNMAVATDLAVPATIAPTTLAVTSAGAPQARVVEGTTMPDTMRPLLPHRFRR
jgi:hypothetical protein